MHFLELLSSDKRIKEALEQSQGQIISLNHAPLPSNDDMKKKKKPIEFIAPWGKEENA